MSRQHDDQDNCEEPTKAPIRSIEDVQVDVNPARSKARSNSLINQLKIKVNRRRQKRASLKNATVSTSNKNSIEEEQPENPNRHYSLNEYPGKRPSLVNSFDLTSICAENESQYRD